MDWLTFISSFLWPVVAVIAIMLFRSEVKGLLAKLSEFKAGPVEAKFREGVDEIRNEQREIESGATPAGHRQPDDGRSKIERPRGDIFASGSDVQQSRSRDVDPVTAIVGQSVAGVLKDAREVVSVVPQYAVLQGYQALELTLREAERVAAEVDPTIAQPSLGVRTGTSIVNNLVRHKVLPSNMREMFREQARLRNEVAHVANVQISAQAATSYLDTIDRSIELVYEMISSWLNRNLQYGQKIPEFNPSREAE